jgi:hypothetical protein
MQMASGDIIVQTSDGLSFYELVGGAQEEASSSFSAAAMRFGGVSNVPVKFPQNPVGATLLTISMVSTTGQADLEFYVQANDVSVTIPSLLDPSKTYDIAIIEH